MSAEPARALAVRSERYVEFLGPAVRKGHGYVVLRVALDTVLAEDAAGLCLGPAVAGRPVLVELRVLNINAPADAEVPGHLVPAVIGAAHSDRQSGTGCSRP